MFKTSWKTSAGGIVGLIAAALTLVVQPYLDNDPSTLPQWSTFVTLAATSLGLIAARDHNVSSEKAGIKPPEA
ncbi:MAG: hypothetical protein A2Y38_22465 [Spirochaetes bacterium GWB1_59_5]|nr:MAG: hypothetical protein A2Y38_22465 [Spirochaetes bacterium GWB1_59_5]